MPAVADGARSSARAGADGPAAGFDPMSLATGAFDRVGDLVRTTLDAGASMARSAAAATGAEDLPPRGESPLEDIVTFGTAAASNLFRYAMDAARTAERFAGTMAPDAAPGPAPAGNHEQGAWGDDSGGVAAGRGRPRVVRGAVLRVPLLVENTGATPTGELAFDASGLGDDVDEITFTPATVIVGAHDFEKLTVRIRTADAAALGAHRVTVTGGDGWFSTVIEFDVVERAA